MDVLRGIAVFGMLLMNIYGYAQVGAIYVNPFALGPLTLSEWLSWTLLRVFTDYKFLAIFSILFGAGIALFCHNAIEAGKPWVRLHIARMFVLAVFGLVHAYLIWFGDILTSYAVCGLFVVLFVKLPARYLFPLGLALILYPVWGFIQNQIAIESAPDATLQAMLEGFWEPSAEAVAREVTAYKGTWSEQFAARRYSVDFILFQLLPNENFWKSSGLMLLGMGLYKIGFFQGKLASGTYSNVGVTGTVLGILICGYGLNLDFKSNFDIQTALHQGRTYLYLSSIPQAIGYAGLVYWLIASSPVGPIFRGLANVGRLAFTNYIMQSIIGTAIFYGWGLGLFGEISRNGLLFIVAGMWAFQFWFSTFWLERYRYGPLEWIWRSATYLQRMPLLR